MINKTKNNLFDISILTLIIIIGAGLILMFLSGCSSELSEEQIQDVELSQNWACMDGCYEMLLEIHGEIQINKSFSKMQNDGVIDIIEYSELKKIHCLCSARCSVLYFPKLNNEDYIQTRDWC